MIPLVLAMQLLGAPDPAPRVHLVPELTLAAPRGAAWCVGPSLANQAAPDLTAPELTVAPGPAARAAVERRPVRVGVVVGAAGGIALADLVTAAVAAVGLLMCIQDIASFGESGGCETGMPLMIVGSLAFAFVPPAAGVLGARGAGERGDAAGTAYLLALAVRLGTFGLAAGLGPSFTLPLVLASDLVLTPWVIARVLAGAPLQPEPGASPAVAARPVRDPAGR